MMLRNESVRRAAAAGWAFLILALPATAVETVGNDVYEVQVQQSSDGTQAGSWNASTADNHPAGGDHDLLYRHDFTSTTNFSSLRIFRSDGTVIDYTFGGAGNGTSLDPHLLTETPSPLAPSGQGWRTVWRIDTEGIEITQDVFVVGLDLDDSAVYHTVAIENVGSEAVRLGWRNLHDWSLSTPPTLFDDGPTNRLESACGTSLEAATRDEFSHRPVAAGWVRVATPAANIDYDVLLSLGFDPGLRPDLPVSVPDEYAYVDWISAMSSSFDYSIQPLSNLGDSAGLSWFGRDATTAPTLAAGESVRFTQVLFAFEETDCPSPKPCTEVPWGLVGWWPFNEPDQGVGGTFDDIARDHDGLARFAPSSIAGKVSRAARFDGDLDQIVIQDAPDLDLPAGIDLTIDFWIRTTDSSGLSVVLEKRVRQPDLVGYQVFLLDGLVGLQLADGGGSVICSSNAATSACTNYLSQAFVADGEWHLVAVTVERDDPQGLVWYLDGEEIGPRSNPTIRDGSLSNDAQLLVGQGDPDAPFAGAPFAGDLDELEIARRVLRPNEILAIYRAGASGKCRFVVDAPWDQALCENDDSVVAQLSVCNEQGGTARVVFDFEGLPAMPTGVPHGSLCQAVGPSLYTLLGDQPLVVPPGECRTAQVRISNPPSQTSGQASCYQVTATDVVSGLTEIDYGFIPRTNRVCCRPRTSVTVLPATPGVSTSVFFDIEDTGLGSPTLDLRAEAFQADEEAPPALRLGGGAPGEPIDLQVVFDAAGRATLEVPVELSEDFAPLNTYDVVISSDLDADTERELLASATLVPSADPCAEGLNQLCLNQDRFQVAARWRTQQGDEGVAQAVPLTTDTGFLWFFSGNNLELVVKVLDACSFGNRYWVFAGGLTNVAVELTVTDLLTGTSKTYLNPLGTPFQPVQDTDAFATCDVEQAAGATVFGDRSVPSAVKERLSRTAQLGSPVTELPLNDERFQVEVEWATTQGTSGAGQGVPITSDTGYFWFFRDTNVELVVKVLDACGFADRFWVFAGGLTNVEVRITVTDTASGSSKSYFNPQGMPFQPIQDTNAFSTCP